MSHENESTLRQVDLSDLPLPLRAKLAETIGHILGAFPEHAQLVAESLRGAAHAIDEVEAKERDQFLRRIESGIETTVTVAEEGFEDHQTWLFATMTLLVTGVAEALRADVDPDHELHGRIDRRRLAEVAERFCRAAVGDELTGTTEARRWIQYNGVLADDEVAPA